MSFGRIHSRKDAKSRSENFVLFSAIANCSENLLIKVKSVADARVVENLPSEQ